MVISWLKKAESRGELVCKKLKDRIEAVPDRILFLSLSIFYFVWRILALPMFEFGGDAVWKWRFLRYFHETGTWFPLAPDHHQGRWAQNIPVLWLMDLFDSTSLWIGAVLPVLCGFIVLVLLWLITRKISTKTAAVMVCLSMMFYPIFYQESAQVLTSLPCSMYILLAIYLFLLYMDKPARLYLPLLAGLSMGLAWGCKVTAAYWCVGFALFLIFFPVSGKPLLRLGKVHIGWDVIVFSAGFLLVFIPEFFIINDFFHVRLGRIGMLGGHVNARLNSEVSPHRYNLFQYLISPLLIFLDFSGKAIYKLPFCLLFLLVCPPLFLQLRDKNLALSRKFIAFSLFVAALIHCYFVVRVFPFNHPERPLPRYFLPLTCVAFLVFYTASPHLPEIRERFRMPVRLIYYVIFTTMILFMFCGWINEPVINGDHLFNKIQAYQCVRIHKEQNLPFLVLYNGKRGFDSRTFKVSMLWKTQLSDLPELAHILSKDTDEMQMEWAGQEPVVDESGRKYFLLSGPRPEPGTAAKCIVVDEAHVRLKNISVSPYKLSTEPTGQK